MDDDKGNSSENVGENIKNLCLDDKLPMQEDSGASGITLNTTEDTTQEEAMKLPCVAIGNTSYSQKNVSDIFLKLHRLNWNQEVEQDLVKLWNMTNENEVCIFLLGFNLPNLVAQNVLTYHRENYRLIEILMGILSNIAFVCKEAMVVIPDDMKRFVNLFYCENVRVLTQLVNFFIHVWSGNLLTTFVDRKFLKQIIVLVKHENRELLFEILSFLSIICVEKVISESLIIEKRYFLDFCVEAFSKVVNEVDRRRRDSHSFTWRQYACFFNLMLIVTHVSNLPSSHQLNATLHVASESLRTKSIELLYNLSRRRETLQSLHHPDMIFRGLLIFLYAVNDPCIVSSFYTDLFRILLKMAIDSTENELSLNYLFELVLYLICYTDNFKQLVSNCMVFDNISVLNFLRKFTHVINSYNTWNFGYTCLHFDNLRKLIHHFEYFTSN